MVCLQQTWIMLSAQMHSTCRQRKPHLLVLTTGLSATVCSQQFFQVPEHIPLDHSVETPFVSNFSQPVSLLFFVSPDDISDLSLSLFYFCFFTIKTLWVLTALAPFGILIL